MRRRLGIVRPQELGRGARMAGARSGIRATHERRCRSRRKAPDVLLHCVRRQRARVHPPEEVLLLPDRVRLRRPQIALHGASAEGLHGHGRSPILGGRHARRQVRALSERLRLGAEKGWWSSQVKSSQVKWKESSQA